MKRCGVCGFTFDDIIRNKSIGCAMCYETFKDEFKSSLRQLNININYKDDSKETSYLLDKVLLQKKMEKAVECENYEKAAVYRDCIKALDNGRD